MAFSDERGTGHVAPTNKYAIFRADFILTSRHDTLLFLFKDTIGPDLQNSENKEAKRISNVTKHTSTVQPRAFSSPFPFVFAAVLSRVHTPSG